MVKTLIKYSLCFLFIFACGISATTYIHRQTEQDIYSIGIQDLQQISSSTIQKSDNSLAEDSFYGKERDQYIFDLLFFESEEENNKKTSYKKYLVGNKYITKIFNVLNPESCFLFEERTPSFYKSTSLSTKAWCVLLQTFKI